MVGVIPKQNWGNPKGFLRELKNRRKIMVLYHGTVLAFANAIHSKGIDTEKNAKSELDFGKGLYVSDIETATVFAFKKVAEIKSWDDIPDESFLIPAIVPIEINEAEFSLLDIKKFEKKDLKWFTTQGVII